MRDSLGLLRFATSRSTLLQNIAKYIISVKCSWKQALCTLVCCSAWDPDLFSWHGPRRLATIHVVCAAHLPIGTNAECSLWRSQAEFGGLLESSWLDTSAACSYWWLYCGFACAHRRWPSRKAGRNPVPFSTTYAAPSQRRTARRYYDEAASRMILVNPFSSNS